MLSTANPPYFELKRGSMPSRNMRRCQYIYPPSSAGCRRRRADDTYDRNKVDQKSEDGVGDLPDAPVNRVNPLLGITIGEDDLKRRAESVPIHCIPKLLARSLTLASGNCSANSRKHSETGASTPLRKPLNRGLKSTLAFSPFASAALRVLNTSNQALGRSGSSKTAYLLEQRSDETWEAENSQKAHM